MTCACLTIHGLPVKAVVHAFLEQRAFAVPKGLPLSFGAISKGNGSSAACRRSTRPSESAKTFNTAINIPPV